MVERCKTHIPHSAAVRTYEVATTCGHLAAVGPIPAKVNSKRTATTAGHTARRWRRRIVRDRKPTLIRIGDRATDSGSLKTREIPPFVDRDKPVELRQRKVPIPTLTPRTGARRTGNNQHEQRQRKRPRHPCEPSGHYTLHRFATTTHEVSHSCPGHAMSTTPHLGFPADAVSWMALLSLHRWARIRRLDTHGLPTSSRIGFAVFRSHDSSDRAVAASSLRSCRSSTLAIRSSADALVSFRPRRR